VWIDLLKNVEMTITNNEKLRQFLESKVVVMSGSHYIYSHIETYNIFSRKQSRTSSFQDHQLKNMMWHVIHPLIPLINQNYSFGVIVIGLRPCWKNHTWKGKINITLIMDKVQLL